jgi:uncharacterized protein with beta-barrel porin domain
MRKFLLNLGLTTSLVWAAASGHAAPFSLTFGESGLNTLIPDEEFIERFHIVSGVTRPGPFSVEVSFKLVPDGTAGGMWNGDYAAYLIHTTEDGSQFATAVLLNRVGRTDLLPSGYDGNGMELTLRDDGLSNVHTYRENLGGFQMVDNGDGTYRVSGSGIPDGRLTNPLQVTTADPVTNLLNALGLLDPNGKWQFKIGDMEAGFRGYLDSWSVTLTQLALVAVDNITTITSGEDVTYPEVMYEPVGVLDIQAGSELSIETPVIMPGKTTTIVNGVFNMMSGGESEACSTLGGNGIINIMGGEPLVLRGRISPGNSIGTLTFNGDIVLDSTTCRTEIEVENPNSFDRVVVNGAATLNAPSLQITTINGGTLSVGDQFTFLTASGGVTGMYNIAALPAGFRANFLVSSTSITLVVAPESYTQMALTPNQLQIAGALDSFIAGEVTTASDCLGPLQGVARTVVLNSGDRGVVSLALDQLTAAQYAQAFEQMMPSMYASLPTLAFNQANALNMSMFQRMWMQRIGGPGFSTRGLDPAPLSDGKQFVPADGKSVLPPDGKSMVAREPVAAGSTLDEAERWWGLFVDGNGIFSTMDNINNLGRYNSQGGGVNVGASYRWNENLTTGVYVGYQGLQAQYENGSRLIDNAVRFGTFASWGDDWGPGQIYVNAIVGGAYHGYDIDRKIQFGTIDRMAQGRPGAWELDAALATGYNLEAGGFVFGPVTSLQYTYVAVQGFTETGAQSLNVDVDPYNSSSLLYSLGGQVAYPVQATSRLSFTPMVFASWQHEFLQDAYNINSSFVGGGPFSYETTAPQRDFLYAGAGIGMQLDDRWEAFVSYSAAAANPDVLSHNIFVGGGVKF